MRGPATAKLLIPSVVVVLGTNNVPDDITTLSVIDQWCHRLFYLFTIQYTAHIITGSKASLIPSFSVLIFLCVCVRL